MAALTFAPLGAGGNRCEKFLFSTWFRFPPPTGYEFYLLSSFLNPTGDNNFGIRLTINYALPGLSNYGVELHAYYQDAPIVYDSLGNYYFPSCNWYSKNSVADTLGSARFALASDTWHHLCSSFDLTSSGSGIKRGWVFIDAVQRVGGPPNFEDNHSTLSDNGATLFPGFSVPTETSALPYPGGDQKMQRGDTQIWFNRYIDLSIEANRLKFYKISSGRGTPEKPALAATAFGTQDYLFKGGASQFFVNSGTGGTATKIGTITDFTPAPSF